MKQNDGFITVRSGVGEGTSISIHPRCYQGPVMALIQEGAPTKEVAGTETLLVVEDEEALLRLVTRMLERHGYTVLAPGLLPTPSAWPGSGSRTSRYCSPTW